MILDIQRLTSHNNLLNSLIHNKIITILEYLMHLLGQQM